MDEINLTYYGYIFDASGYGQAARAYVHALHRAGINLSVVDLNRHEKQVHDELIEGLLNRPLTADFHLFHGIPPQWARLAFRMSNAIGMTVWETDAMPTQWRNALSHVLEVWLPCQFNVSTFSRELRNPVFKLPHAILPTDFNGSVPEPNHFLRVGEKDFVFYSIFEWQDRKSPQGVIEAFLRAFPQPTNAVLILKANHQAAALAERALCEARQKINSEARVLLRCEAWGDAEIEALHRRGDCYVSLHRGEGWGYPLFEAARRGTPVVATNYSGPLDYLSHENHYLVRCAVSPVRQPYVYYHPRMNWAEPDFMHAAELLRAVFENRDVAKNLATQAAEKIRRDYSLEAVGRLARERLLELLKRAQPQKWKAITKRERQKRRAAASEISGDWYDEDYFETGAKSNWEGGYSWAQFQNLFRDTAKFLTTIFSEARSFLDVGCAKGFLVRALIEQGKEAYGFDHSDYAIAQVDASAKAFISKAGVDEFRFDRQVDVLTAFSIFESLTEAQAFEFLSRARSWTRQAIVATISCFEDETEEAFFNSEDLDLSHITIRSRAWWHELFLRAGWQQDAVHRVAARLCQTHELPTKMAWKVLVYAPGDEG
jgi:glycosyltransferase involved in cell wall biosynthesis/cyclopropane fatty-acyl-phospholipid synthase-like methyltransferase